MVQAASQARPMVRAADQAGPMVQAANDARQATQTTDDAGPTDLERLVTAAQTAAALAGLPSAKAPWLPELPVELAPHLLAAPEHGLPFALIDLPDQQRQETAVWDLAAGHLAVVGGPRSGRSTTLRTLCLSTGHLPGLSGVLYFFDPARQHGDLEAAGHAEAVVGPDDHERSTRLLRLVLRELRERQSEPTARRPVLLFVDGWEALTAAWSEPGLEDLQDDLLKILRDGPGVGICVAVAGDASLLAGRHSSWFSQRLVLTLPDPTDAMVLGVPAGLSRATGPPGRGSWLAAGDNEFRLAQVAYPQDSVGPRTPDRSWSVPALPGKLSRADLPGAPGALFIGVGGERVRPLRMDVTSQPVTLVLGPRASGRTTALLSLLQGLEEKDVPTLLISGRDVRRPTAAAEVADALTGHPGTVVLLDLPTGPGLAGPGDDALAEVLALHLAGGQEGAGHLVLTASGPEVAAAYRGVLTLARDARQGLVLGAVSPVDGEVLGVHLRRRPAGPPGRGLLIRSGDIASVQVATPTSGLTRPTRR